MALAVGLSQWAMALAVGHGGKTGAAETGTGAAAGVSVLIVRDGNALSKGQHALWMC